MPCLVAYNVSKKRTRLIGLVNRKAHGITSRRQEIDRCLEELGPVRYEGIIRANCLSQSLTGLGNLVLQDTVERLFAQNLYADVDRGLFLVRGENVLLLGEIVRRSISPCSKSPLTIRDRIWIETIMFPLPSSKQQSTKSSNYTSKSRHKRRSRRRSGTRSWPHTASRASTLERLFCDVLYNKRSAHTYLP